MEINSSQKKKSNWKSLNIEIWYNKKRRHGTLNYKTIEEFNNQNRIYKNVA